jgi:hypothetical protein
MPLRRWWIAFVLACALAGAQSLAFVHRVAHPGHAASLAGMGHPAHHAAASKAPAPASLLAALFVGHDADGPVCHLFDAAAPDGLPSPLVAMPVLAPVLLALLAPAAPCARPAARPFDARGPPAGY